MSNRYSEFIRANQELWSRIPTDKGSNDLLLVEAQRHPVISHANAVFARIIKEAKGLNIGWINTGNQEIQERLASYDSTSYTVSLNRLTRFDKLIVILQFARSALKMLLTGDILSFSLDGIYFGDILYDSYLARFEVATVPGVNKGVLSTLLILIKNHYRFKKTIQACGASAVLVSHPVGISSGVLMRTALRLGLSAYLRTAGLCTVTLNLLNSLSEIYQGSYRPRSVDMQLLLSIDQETLNKEFQDLMEKRIQPHYHRDADRAYDEKKKVYNSKHEFAEEFQISAAKKFVFVMLHSFNDYPRSHFGQMLFRDYYDWFVQTLGFARIKSDVNWIFKEHPAAAFYPTRDISVADHFVKCPDHIIFLDTDSSFNSKSISYIADVVVTVAGTAGVEFAAAGGIPPIVAGANEYSGFGFTIEPSTQIEYFQVLATIEKVNKLKKSQQDMARRIFLYYQQYSYVPFSWSPLCTFEETRDPDMDSYYWTRALAVYAKNSDMLLAEFEKYVEYVRESDFSRLAQLQFSEEVSS